MGIKLLITKALDNRTKIAKKICVIDKIVRILLR